ncbi:MAG: mechanosensitive ion channel family protein [Halieaceae bacterium]|jgi:MscS family membrane protein|nr:mechanosensitive ion channel family protein [Halieaceae bacterium]
MFEHLQESIESYLGFISGNIFIQALIVVIGAGLFALAFDRVVVAWVRRQATRTTANIDDELVGYLHRPLFYSVLLLGLSSAIMLLRLPEQALSPVFSVLYSIALVIWAQFFLRITRLILRGFASNPDRAELLHSKTLPLFENLASILIVGIAIYYLFVSWNIDMTAWLASAGIVGIAVGFAAKDTLANLFSGVFIMADAPYKIGDFVVLDAGERGEITKIGIRSTRLLTRDDVEVTVPNAVMGNTKIINESGGHHEKFRIRVQICVAYGSDIDRVRDILTTIGNSEPSTCGDPEPRVRFRRFGTSGLDFELLCWIDKPVLRGRILDRLNSAVYKSFIEAGIEIPYFKQDVYIKEIPSR